MSGRDPHEPHRAATPLELLFELTFVISFGLAAFQLAHALAEGHYAVALLGFGFASFGISGSLDFGRNRRSRDGMDEPVAEKLSRLVSQLQNDSVSGLARPANAHL